MNISRRYQLLLALTVSIGLVWIYIVVSTFALPPVSHLRLVTPETTAFMKQYDGKEKIHHFLVPLSAISIHLQQAVVIAEDDRFFEHGGFDWEAIKRAARIDWKRGRFSHGASTITMQLARNLYLSPSKNPLRKIEELLIALKLEWVLPKERILELYLNCVEWGDGIYGAEAAAQHYFGVSAQFLGKYEAAFLAAILPRPRYYDHHREGQKLYERIAIIESRL